MDVDQEQQQFVFEYNKDHILLFLIHQFYLEDKISNFNIIILFDKRIGKKIIKIFTSITLRGESSLI